MNKTELLTDLAGRYSAIGPATKQPSSEGNINIYQVGCYTVTGDVADRVITSFAVVDEGQPGEVAYWLRHEPGQSVKSQFVKDVEAFIAAKIADGTINAAFIQDYDESREIAVTNAYHIAAGKLTKVEAIIYRDSGTGLIDFRLVGS